MSDYTKGIPCEQISTRAWEYLLSSLSLTTGPSARPSITVCPSMRGRRADARAPPRFFAPCNFPTTHGIIGRCVWAEARPCAPLARQEGNRTRGSAVQPIQSLRNFYFPHKPWLQKEPTSYQGTNELVYSRLLINKLLGNWNAWCVSLSYCLCICLCRVYYP